MPASRTTASRSTRIRRFSVKQHSTLPPDVTRGADEPSDNDTALHVLARAVRATPDRVFLDFEGDTYTYAETDRLATCFAHELIGLGLRPGQTVATVLDNCMDQVVTFLAVNKAGGVWVPVNTAYRGAFLRHPLDDSQAAIVVTDSRYVEHIAEIADSLPLVRTVLRRGDDSIGIVHRGSGIAVLPLDDYRGTDDTPIPISAEPGDLSLLIFTSGTTGVSKGCMISYNYMLNQGRMSNIAVPLTPDDVAFTPLPLFHASAVDLVLTGLLSGARVSIASRFSLSGFWSEIERSGATYARLMASIFPLVANAADSPEMHRCRGQLHTVGGSPFPPELRKVWRERFGVRFADANNYGQTEGCRLSISRFGDENMPQDSCGKIADDYEVVILDDDDRIVPDGVIGEIAFRPRKPNIMFSGYWRQPEATLGVWRNLWMHTGDIGRIDNGYLFFVDRKKDYLRSRGENISSFEVERAFLVHPAIADVAAHAVDVGIAEDCLKITAVIKDGHTLEEQELCLWAIDHVPHFAVPRYIEFRKELPRTATNKIQKAKLREEGSTAETWDREAAGIQVRRK